MCIQMSTQSNSIPKPTLGDRSLLLSQKHWSSPRAYLHTSQLFLKWRAIHCRRSIGDESEFHFSQPIRQRPPQLVEVGESFTDRLQLFLTSGWRKRQVTIATKQLGQLLSVVFLALLAGDNVRQERLSHSLHFVNSRLVLQYSSVKNLYGKRTDFLRHDSWPQTCMHLDGNRGSGQRKKAFFLCSLPPNGNHEHSEQRVSRWAVQRYRITLGDNSIV